MEKVCLNGAWELSVPDGFKILSREEIDALHAYGEPPRFCISDPERHILLCAGWKPAGLAGWLAGVADIARGAEARIRTPMRQFGYRRDEFCSRLLGGRKAEGFRYQYQAQGVYMIGETWVMKENKTIYNIHVYFRRALKEDSRPVIEEILGSIRWM